MVCELPAKFLPVIRRYQYCYQTEPIVGERTTARTKPWYGKPLRECETTLVNGMSSAGASESGVGVHRRTFSFRDRGRHWCVVKVARTPDEGTEANRVEEHAYRTLPRSIRGFFIPVSRADEDGWWITQPMADTDADVDAGELEGELADKGYECSDLHEANVGEYKGRPVVLDYGFGVSGRKLRCPIPLPLTTKRRPPARRETGQRSLMMFARRR